MAQRILSDSLVFMPFAESANVTPLDNRLKLGSSCQDEKPV
jgi:hypothetical protein